MTRRLSAVALGAAILCGPTHAQLPPPPAPPGNPLTQAKADLGKALFWDEQLSSTGTVSCGTCHMPEAGGSDPRSFSSPGSVNPGPDQLFGTEDDIRGSLGVPRARPSGHYASDSVFGLFEQVTGRKAPSAIGAGHSKQLFWDGRAGEQLVDPASGQILLFSDAALESQALAPIVSDIEMGHLGRDWHDVVTRVAAAEPLALSDFVPAALDSWIANRSYPQLFSDAFGSAEITPARIAMAIASYERTLLANNTPWDRILAGQPVNEVLTDIERQGLLIFLDPDTSGCGDCHSSGLGPVRFTDDLFHNIGVRPPQEDLGRFNVTGEERDRGAFRTPDLRNVVLRAPYMHNGSLRSLGAVIDFYDRGGDFDAPNLHPSIQPLGLSLNQKRSLLAFLGRPLTDPRIALGLPPFDRPSQYADSAHVPAELGLGTAGGGGFVPRIIALEPPQIGQDDLTVGIDHALGGAPALLLFSSSYTPGGVFRDGATLFPDLAASGVRRLRALSGSGPGAGWGSIVLPIQGDTSLVGSSLYAQWVVLDPGAEGGRLAASPAVEWGWF
jgi:cytochrome c peroxidase